MSITTQLILQDARRASVRAAFSLFVTISGIRGGEVVRYVENWASDNG